MSSFVKFLLLAACFVPVAMHARDGELRISEVYSSKGTTYVIAIVEEESDGGFWSRTGGNGGIYFGDPNSGQLDRLTALPRTSSTAADGNSEWKYTILLQRLGQKAEVKIETSQIEDKKKGSLTVKCKGLSSCLIFNDSETKRLEATRANNSLKLFINDKYRRVEHVLYDSDSMTYYIVDFAGFSKGDSSGVEIMHGPKGNLKFQGVRAYELIQPIGTGLLIRTEREHDFVADILFNSTTVDFGKLSSRITLEDGRTLFIPGPTDKSSLPRVIVGNDEVFLDIVENEPEILFRLGYDMERILPLDYGLCDVLGLRRQ